MNSDKSVSFKNKPFGTIALILLIAAAVVAPIMAVVKILVSGGSSFSFILAFLVLWAGYVGVTATIGAASVISSIISLVRKEPSRQRAIVVLIVGATVLAIAIVMLIIGSYLSGICNSSAACA